MEATTAAKVVCHDDLAPSRPAGASDTEERILEVLRKAQVREDRHMTQKRIAQELGAFRGGCAPVYRTIAKLSASGRVLERLDMNVGETTYHLPGSPKPQVPFAPFGLAGSIGKIETRYPCPDCSSDFLTERGKNIHVGQMHKAQGPALAGTADVTDDEEDEDELEEVVDAGASWMTDKYGSLLRLAEKRGWKVEVLQASKEVKGVGKVTLTYGCTVTRVAS